VRRAGLLALCVAACQPQSSRLLLLDLARSDPVILDATAAPWHAAGYAVEYRRYYPHLTHHDLARYHTLVLLGGREPEASSDALTLGDVAILTEWVRQGGVVVVGYAGDGEGFFDRWVMNRWLAAMGTGLVIGDFPLEDSPRVFPLPHSALDNAGVEPFPAGRNHVVLVRRESQVLARSSATAFVRPPREAPAPRPHAAVVAAARVGAGLVLVVSRHALAASGTDLRPNTLPAVTALTDARRSRVFLDALARWTRRPAEWAAVAPAQDRVPLTLAGAPLPVAVHPPPLAPPAGAGVVVLPLPPARPVAAREPRAGVPNWINRQGMRVLWTRTPQRGLDSMLAFVDVGALNVLATEVVAPARADSLGLRNIWKPTAARLQATSLRWFPAIALAELRPEGEAGTTRDLDVRGDTATVLCALDSLFWRGALRPAYRALARLGGGQRGSDVVAGVALDLDVARGGYAATGFCDATYREGLDALDIDTAEAARLAALPPAVRYDSLLQRGLLGRYEAALEQLVAQRAATLRAELRRLNPDLRFAFRSAQLPSDWFSLGLLRGFSDPDTPVFLWTREPRVREVLERYRARGIFALSAVGLTPERIAANEWPRLRPLAFVEHDGFWLPWVQHADSLGRLVRRLAR
jgi:hypothetical protein